MARNYHPATTLSVRISPEMINQLKELAEATGRTKSYLAAQAIASYLQIQAWQVQEIQKAVQKADSPQAKFFSHQQIEEWVNSWDSPDELEPPK